jgi:hypothetical protein
MKKALKEFASDARAKKHREDMLKLLEAFWKPKTDHRARAH